MSELTGAELDLAVAKALGWLYGQVPSVNGEWLYVMEGDGCFNVRAHVDEWKPSTNWAQLGPLIEEYDVNLSPGKDFNVIYGPDTHWRAVMIGVRSDDTIFEVFKYGPTPLIAACRAIVASVEEKNND